MKSNYSEHNAQSSDIPSWVYEQAKRQQRKQNKTLRQAKQNRKNVWMLGE